VPGASSDLTVELARSDDNRWFVIRLAVGDDVVLNMVPNPGFPRSVVSRRVWDDLVARGMLAASEGRTVVLRDLRIEQQRSPDLPVRVSPLTRILGVDGILGFDFFENYTGVYFDIRARRLTLIDP